VNGTELITAERERQIHSEGWSPKHDDKHDDGQLLEAAVCYVKHAQHGDWTHPITWPWEKQWWKPSKDQVRDLVKAGALIAAEIDRLLRIRK
jgi:hypothetical protein